MNRDADVWAEPNEVGDTELLNFGKLILPEEELSPILSGRGIATPYPAVSASPPVPGEANHVLPMK